MNIYFINIVTDKLKPLDIGLAYVASHIKNAGYNVMIESFLEEEVNYEQIIEYKPDVIGFTTYSITIKQILNVCKNLKSLLPDVYIVLGGVLATYKAEELLRIAPYISAIIRKEGEATMLDFISSLSKKSGYSGIRGISYSEEGRIIHNHDREPVLDLNSLPFPLRDKDIKSRDQAVILSSSRGCYCHCSFCYASDYWQKKVRSRSINNVVDEIEEIVSKYNKKFFCFIDLAFEDNLGREENLIEFYDELKKRRLDIVYSVNFKNTFHRKFDSNIDKYLKESGLASVSIGIDSFDEEDFSFYNKGGSVTDNIKLLDALEESDYLILLSLIGFNPYSTIEKVKKNITMTHRYKALYSIMRPIYPLINYEGLRINEKIKKDGLFNNDWNLYHDFNYQFVDKKIENLFYSIQNFLNSKRMFSIMSQNTKITEHIVVYFYNNRSLMSRLYKEDSGGFDRFFNDFYANLMELNQLNFEWFMKILDKAENSSVGDYLEYTFPFERHESLYNSINKITYNATRYLVKNYPEVL